MQHYMLFPWRHHLELSHDAMSEMYRNTLLPPFIVDIWLAGLENLNQGSALDQRRASVRAFTHQVWDASEMMAWLAQI